jgi:glycosyltransferase involved in cell wall biosynthesis
MFGWEFPPHNSGGLGTACEGLTRALAAEQVAVTFVLPRTASVTADFLRWRFAGLENFKFCPVPGLLQPYITGEVYDRLRAEAGPSVYGHNLLAEVRLYAERARQIALEEDYDVIHAHDWLAFPAGLMAKRASGKPLVVHVHATEFDRGGGAGVNQAVYEIEREGMKTADRIIAVSQWTKDIVVAKYGIPAAKVSVVHNGIALGDYAARPAKLTELKAHGSKIVLFVGRITLQKGPDYFVQTARRVLELEPRTYFVMVGSGDMEGQVIRLAAELGVADHFIFPGFLRGAELNEVYQAADLYVLPSVSEPFGITPLESLANGTPVLVSKQSGVAEVLSHALKADFWDIDEMTNQIVSVLRHPPLRQTLADCGAREAGGVSWGKAAVKCLDIYQQLISPTWGGVRQ